MKLLPLSFCLLISLCLFGQREDYRIALTDKSQAYDLGIPLDHGVRWERDSLTVPADHMQESVLQALGVSFIKTVTAVASATEGSVDDCGNEPRIQLTDPVNFELGSLNAGYYSLADTWAAFAKMRTLYPDLISERMAVSTFRTHEDRELYYYRLSDNPDQEENEPRAFFNSLHHAREPASLVQSVYFTWWLLENYGTDPEATWLVDNTELYLMPIVNPDGYAFNGGENQTGDLDFWRKNRRDNGDGTFGVDLNRNYPFGWAGPGASGNTSSDIYYGPGPLSEPEAQAVDWLHRKYAFATVLNVHSYSDLVITPGTGLSDDPDLDGIHAQLSWVMRENNRYGVGPSELTVGYTASGNSDDYFALWTENNKPIAVAMTPEIGYVTSGFLPERDLLRVFCRDAFLVNWRALQSVHPTVIAEFPNKQLLVFNGPNSVFKKFPVVIRNTSTQLVNTTLELTQAGTSAAFEANSIPVSVPAGDSIHIDLEPSLSLAYSGVDIEISFAGLAHVKPVILTDLSAYSVDTLLFDPIDDNNNVFGEDIITTNVSNHATVIGYNGQPNFGFSTEVTTTSQSSPRQFRISYDHNFALNSNAIDVAVAFNSTLDMDDVQCTNHTSITPDYLYEAFWGTTPGFVRDEILIDVPAVGDTYRLSWIIDDFDISTESSYQLDNVLIELLTPNVIVSADEVAASDTHYTISPNPANNYVNIDQLADAAQVRIINMQGQEVAGISRNGQLLSLPQLASGLYTILIQDEGSLESLKLVIE